MFYVLFSCKVQWSHLASLKNNVSPVSRSHSFSDPSPKFAHHHLRSQDPYPPSRSEVLNQSSDSKSEVPDPTQKAWARSDSDEVPPRVRSRKTDVCYFFIINCSFLKDVMPWALGRPCPCASTGNSIWKAVLNVDIQCVNDNQPEVQY